jgi:hypothetical protein
MDGSRVRRDPGADEPAHGPGHQAQNEVNAQVSSPDRSRWLRLGRPEEEARGDRGCDPDEDGGGQEPSDDRRNTEPHLMRPLVAELVILSGKHID